MTSSWFPPPLLDPHPHPPIILVTYWQCCMGPLGPSVLMHAQGASNIEYWIHKMYIIIWSTHFLFSHTYTYAHHSGPWITYPLHIITLCNIRTTSMQRSWSHFALHAVKPVSVVSKAKSPCLQGCRGLCKRRHFSLHPFLAGWRGDGGKGTQKHVATAMVSCPLWLCNGNKQHAKSVGDGHEYACVYVCV